MGKTTAPLLSFDASGQVAKTIVYAKWRGVSYARRHVIPANPQSAAQTQTRILFAWLNAIWKNAPADFVAPWNLFASGQSFLGRNAFIGKNVNLMRGETDLLLMNFSPGAKGGVAPASLSAADGVGESIVTGGEPNVPTGWAIAGFHCVGLLQQDPQTELVTPMAYAEDIATPFDTATLSGLAVGTAVVGGWYSFTRADGTLAYGPAMIDTATIT